MLLSNYHYDGDVKTQPPWLAVNRSNYEKQQMIYFYLHFLFLFLYLFIYLFIYLFYGLGSNVTNPADGGFLAFAVRMSLQAVNSFRISLLSTLFCYMRSSFAFTTLIMNCFSCARALLRWLTWLYPVSWKLDDGFIYIIQLSHSIVT